MFEVVFTASAVADLGFLKRAGQKTVLGAVEDLLTKQPLVQTRNRKPLRPNNLSTWEARIGLHRVFYDVDEVTRKVTVKAVGRKEHNKLFIRGKEFKL
jgi:mRNA-degrading endonuclease RelE of RelBE toxin-antitoxin system